MLTKIRTFLRHSENVKYDLHQHLMTQHMQKVNKLHEWKGIECFHAFQWMFKSSESYSVWLRAF